MDQGGKNAKQEIVVELLEEIVVEILLRLLVKSLLKFKTVCKSWYSTISSDRFIREHLKLAKATTYNQHKKFLSFLVPDSEANSACVLFKEDSGGVIVAKEFDFLAKNLAAPKEEISLWVCNSCDGFICFRTEDNIIIWNPSLPAEYKEIDSASFTGIAGMGYDMRTNDYRIVLVPRYSFVDEFSDGYLYIHLFSLKRESWTTLKITKTKDHEILNTNVIDAKNRLHWLAGDYLGEDSEDYDEIEEDIFFIMYFDLVEDSLNYLNLPLLRAKLVIPMNYKGSLAIAGCNPEGEEEIWVLQEYRGMKSSWNRIFKIPGSWLPTNCCFSMNGE